MYNHEMDSAVFRESIRQLERDQKSKSLGKGSKPKHTPKFIIERKAVGSVNWQPFSSHFSKKKAAQSLPQNTEFYEYRIRNGSHAA